MSHRSLILTIEKDSFNQHSLGAHLSRQARKHGSTMAWARANCYQGNFTHFAGHLTEFG